MSLLGGGPIRDSETLEEGSGSSVEVDISNSLKKGFRVEILSIDVELNVRFLVELVHIEVFNSNTDFSSLLDVEAIGDESEVGVDESDGFGN